MIGVRGLVLALAVLHLVRSAASTSTCTEGTARLELVAAGAVGACHGSSVAKCFNSFTVATTAACALRVAPVDPGGATSVLVPSLFAAGDTYAELVACPAAGQDSLATSFTDDSLLADLRALLASAIWPTPLTTLGALSAAGGVLSTNDSSTGSVCALDWQVVSATGLFAWKAPVAACTAGPACSSSAAGCAAGRYGVAITGAAEGFACPLCRAGSYSAGGVTACTAVAAGRELPTLGAASDTSTPCAAGSYAETAGSSSCAPCPANTYQDASGADTCGVCPSKSYAHLPGAAACMKCVNGRATSCTLASCSAASASSGYAVAAVKPGGLGTLDACPAWNFAAIAAFGPRPALFATCSMTEDTVLSFFVKATCEVVIAPLADATATATALACSAPGNAVSSMTGFYTAVDTILSKLSTASGSIVKVAKSGSDAALSLYSATTDPNPTTQVACGGTLSVTGAKMVTLGTEICPIGTLASTAGGAKSCAPCSAGKYCATAAGTGDASTTAASCPAGNSQPLLGATGPSFCAACAAGTFAASAATATCASCPVGSFQNATGQQSCADCPGALVARSVTCSIACQPNEFLNPATDQCETCPAGQGVVLSAGGAPSCAACPAGQASPANSSTCTPCVSGTYAPVEGAGTCLACPIGVSGGTGAESCTACPAGQEARANSSSCSACDAGFYRAQAGDAAAALCARCPSGSATDAATGATNCSACPIGTFSSWTDAATRVPAAGETCQPCAAGTAGALPGQTKCVACLPGQYTAERANTPLHSGTDHGAVACAACAAGTWRPAFSDATQACQPCDAGSETGETAGAIQCTFCRAGTFAAAANTSFCADCPVDHSSEEGAVECATCPAGSDSAGEPGSQCAPCPPGAVNPTAGQACVACDRGQFQSEAGQTACKPCSVGFYARVSSSAKCSFCPPGMYAGVRGSSGCRLCVAGTSSVGGAGSCTLCAKGYFASPGAKRCTACPIGTYASLRGSAACVKCPAGWYCDIKAMTAPKRCPAGQFSPAKASKKCTKCAVNTFSSGAGAPACKRCPLGLSTRGRTGAIWCTDASGLTPPSLPS